MFWDDLQLRQWAQGGGITPYAEERINPASVDLRYNGQCQLYRF